MRGVKTVRNLVLVLMAAVLAVGLLAACGSGGNVGVSGGLDTSGVSGSGGTGDNGGASVTGIVTWPDQNPAANASVYFSIFDTGFNGNGSGWSPGEGSTGTWDGTWYYQVNQLPADGSYSLPGCPCSNLTAFLDLPPVVGADTPNGGRGCIIIMQDDSGNYSGLQANPGDVIDWHVLDMNCSPVFYPTDPSSVQSERITTDPSQNGGDYTLYAGTWQAAESRTSGGGSSG
jgi:hypothetical protein